MAALAAAQIEAIERDRVCAVSTHARMAHAAADSGATLVIFPELSLTGYSRSLTLREAITSADPTLLPLRQTSIQREIVVLAGAPVASTAGLLIAALAFLPDGRVATYTKEHLHPGEEETFAAGHGGDLVKVGDVQVGLAICAEIAHRPHVEQTTQRGAKVYAASCLLTPDGYEDDCRVLQGYAKRYSVMVVMSNFAGRCGESESAGGSRIWDRRGRVLAAAPSTGEHLVVAERTHDGRWEGRSLLL